LLLLELSRFMVPELLLLLRRDEPARSPAKLLLRESPARAADDATDDRPLSSPFALLVKNNAHGMNNHARITSCNNTYTFMMDLSSFIDIFSNLKNKAEIVCDFVLITKGKTAAPFQTFSDTTT
jgi:hypothetical protein